MSGKKCQHCGSSDIEVDPARGDAVCTNCGTVLEDNIIVAEVEFQDNAHGGATAIGQFVSAESKGGATGFGRAFNAGIGQESREITIRRARNGIIALCQQLRLNQQCIDIAVNFFKMALSKHLTKGRPASHVHAACVYITCRTEGTAHLLIDISDALHICCYQLGRTYMRLSRALCITLPSIDPCIYILRFASQLQFGDKKHNVTMTALRLVQRMKKDSIHLGRRPSGLCGAALLIAARLHDFSRTPADVVRIVRVHESTLRKRLLEFGDTPSSALTLEEFMTVDLEEEQDPPAFRAARKRDKERLQKLIEDEDGEKELTDLQREIDIQLEKDKSKKKATSKPSTPSTSSNIVNKILELEFDGSEDAEACRFAAEDTLELLGEIVEEVDLKKQGKSERNQAVEKGLGPDFAILGLGQPDESKNDDKALDPSDPFLKPEPKLQFNKDLVNPDELIMSDKDEMYIDSLIMSESEVVLKTKMWQRINAGYLENQKIKEELKAKEREEGKKKKIRGSYKKKVPINAATAGEAIEKMLQAKRISSKINYDILKSLDTPQPSTPARSDKSSPLKEEITIDKAEPVSSEPIVLSSPLPKRRRTKPPPALPVVTPSTPSTPVPSTPAPNTPAAEPPATPALTDVGEESDEDDCDITEITGELSLADMLHNKPEEDYYDYEEY